MVEKWEKEKEVQKFEYLENERRSYGKIKGSFTL